MSLIRLTFYLNEYCTELSVTLSNVVLTIAISRLSITITSRMVAQTNNKTARILISSKSQKPNIKLYEKKEYLHSLLL
jgi:hypothetical protein